MVILGIVLAVLFVVALISFLVRNHIAKKNHEGSKTVDVSPLQNIYGTTAIPDLDDAIEQSEKQQDMMYEVVESVKDIFTNQCGDSIELLDDDMDFDDGSFLLRYRVQDCDDTLVFDCKHFGTFDLYFEKQDKSETEKEFDKMYHSYHHAMDKDNISEAIAVILKK